MKKIFLVLAVIVSLGLFVHGSFLGSAAAQSDSTPILLAQAAQPTQPAPAAKPAAPAAQPKVTKVEVNRGVTITLFVIIIIITLGIVVWAASRTKTTADFYAARGAITGTQNGWAIAGDYMSAASFLGIAGLISLYGYDGFMYSVGWLVAYVTVLLIVAEPCRNAGKYTMGDILSFRSSPKPVRAAAAISTVAVSTFYLTAQMVGAGKLMELLLGIPFKFAIAGVGALMIVYVVFGGMIATTWVQIIKAGLLMTGAGVLCLLVAYKAGFNPVTFFSDIATNSNIQKWVQLNLLKDVIAKPGFDYGQRFLEPGLLLKNTADQISLGMALVLGTAGMPHILMRFFTVPTAQAARKSVIIAMFIIGTFYILTTLLGFGSAIHVSPQQIFAVDKGGNMANMLLAQMLGNEIVASWFGDFLLAFLCAVAFATILAVVSGLVLAASAAISHDIYVNIIKGGKADQREQVVAARVTSVIVGFIAVCIGIAAERQNVAHLVALAFAVASSGNLPVVVLSLFWRKMNTAGICGGLILGTVISIGLVLVSPNMIYPQIVAADAQKAVVVLQQKQAEKGSLTEAEQQLMTSKQAEYEKNKDGTSMMGLAKPWFSLKNPGIISIPCGFLAAILFSILFPSKREEDAFDELYVRQNTGIGVAASIGH